MEINQCGCGGKAVIMEYNASFQDMSANIDYSELYIECQKCGVQTRRAEYTLMGRERTDKERLINQLTLIWNRAHPNTTKQELNNE